MKKLILSVVSLALTFVYSVAAQQHDPRDVFFENQAIRVLIFSGRNNHDWRSTTPYLAKVLRESGRFDVRITDEPAGLGESSLRPYDLIVLNYMGPRWGETTEHAVASFVSEGKGVVVVHGASYAFSGLEVLGDNHLRTGIIEDPWEEYLEITGGIWSEESPKTGHGDYHLFDVKITNTEHPITKGLPPSFKATDELYHDLRMISSVNVLATAFSEKPTGGTGEDEPILWTLEYGSGRVFHTLLGHSLASMMEPGFTTTFLRGAEWAARGLVSAEAAAPSELSLLVVTGGHDYDSEFYSVLDVPGTRWRHVTSNHAAYKEDFRADTDVLVLYDMSTEISPDEKAHLKAFVEDDKGLVVIHHAIADYNNWEWWWTDVVGGRYILEGGPDPPSSYRHDVELFVKVVETHPITHGLEPMHLTDETYTNMWIAPGVRVLLRTDEPTSDGPLAWISPFDKSRVVYIQLGHDRQAFGHPGYRRLITQAILWAGKALPRK